MINYVGKCLLIKEKDRKLLIIGDLHLGYEEYLNRFGVFVSRQMFNEMVDYLNCVFKKIGNVDEIVLLGDVKHDFGSIGRQGWGDVLKLFEYVEDKCKKIIIARGNHDNFIGPIAKGSDVDVNDFYVWGEYCFIHGDKDFKEIYEKKIRCWVVGHGHPAVKISDNIKTEKYKCFLVGKYKNKKIILVPSFFSYKEGSDPRENDLGLAWKFRLNKFSVKIAGKNLEVLDFGKLKDLK